MEFFDIFIPIVLSVFGSTLISHGLYLVSKTFLSSAEVIYLAFIEVLKVGWAATGILAASFLAIQFLKFIWESITHFPSLEQLLHTIMFTWLNIPMDRRNPARPPPMFQFQGPNPNYNDIYGLSPTNSRRRTRMRSISTSDLGSNIFEPRIPTPTHSSPQFSTYNDIFGNSAPRCRPIPHGGFHHSNRHLSSFLVDDNRGGGERRMH